ncbi:hypothetical protein E4K72_01570 [Oxalobacteraceae bacterium OM1]|nr:hypothetical protein E4K72_01570 [Oxalobacteraceae bacterium OM1]
MPGNTAARPVLGRVLEWFHARMEDARRRNQQALVEESKALLRAKRRSLGLMLSLLTPEQREEFRTRRYFHVIGGSSGTRYRITVAPFANIDIIGPTGRPMYRLCAHPGGDVPVYDIMAAQMLHLQDPATEMAFLRRANVHALVTQSRRPERSFWVP